VKAAFLDIDKTLYNGFIFYEWAKHLEQKGILSFIDFTKFHEIGLFYKLGAYDYTEAATMTSEVIGEVLKGNDYKEVLLHTEEFMHSLVKNYYEYTPALLKFLKERGYFIVFVTTEPDFLAELIKSQIGGDDAIGIDYQIENEVFTGKLTNDLFSHFGKANTVKEYAKDKGIDLSECFAIGDSQGDVEMLKLTGKAVIINKEDSIKKAIEGTQIKQVERSVVIEGVIMAGV
jgi:HAD superfamily hydrolase (TIGR01490 family)